MQPVLEITNVGYEIAGRQILTALDLSVDVNQYVAIAGVNGAGKSTLIKIILDLLRPLEGGSVKLFGIDNRETVSRQKVVYLPEKFDIRRTVTGYQYLQLIASMYRQPLDRNRCIRLAERLDFPADQLNHHSGSYSKGMVQKLGLISCFMLDCELLILDEPLSGLDPKARYCFKHGLAGQQPGILLARHMLADAEELCDRFAILHDGQFRYLGTPSACMTRYGQATLENAYMRCISEAPAS